MKIRSACLAIVTMAIAAPAFADDTYTIHEALHPDQKVACEMTFDYHCKTTTSTNGKPAEVADSHLKQFYKVGITVAEVKDGSATKMNILVDPASYSISQDSGGKEKKSALPFSGQTIELRRLKDESVANDFKGDADPNDLETLNEFLNPDQDFYPAKPVAVGDTWEVSDKLSKHFDLGPTDQLLAQCRLDSVKAVDGKKLAQITCSCAEIRHEDGNVEEDVESNLVLTVDIAAGQIIKSDLTSKSKFVTPATEAVQVTGGTETTAHTECVAPTPATTQP